MPPVRSIHTGLLDAMDSSLVRVESVFMKGFAGINLIGNNTEVCRQGINRAQAALESINLAIPDKKVMINTFPANLKKDGSHFDLPFAVSLWLLMFEGTLAITAQNWLFAAELGLDGTLRPVKGVISFALAALAGRLEGIIVAQENIPEVQTIRSMSDFTQNHHLQILGFSNIRDVIFWLQSGDTSFAVLPDEIPPCHEPEHNLFSNSHTFDDMLLTPAMEKVALVVASGMHNLFLNGTPGTGKSMFASRLTSIMPPMSAEDHLDALRIHSSYTHTLEGPLIAGRPPFRGPHHGASASAILGIPEEPGEISLSHGGILFLDEFPEFRRDVIESLREPLETGHIRVSRAKRKVMWKSKVILVAACNNCPCGWLGSLKKKCSCSSTSITAYRRKMSGPILDRMDIHVNVKEYAGGLSELFFALKKQRTHGERTQTLYQNVKTAREFAAARNKTYGVLFNRDLKSEHLADASELGDQEFEILVRRFTQKQASNRSAIRLIRVARTLADLEQSRSIREQDFLQATAWMPEACAQERGDYAYGMG